MIAGFLGLVLAGSMQVTGWAQDNYEPNDTWGQAPAITLGGRVNSYISDNVDVDYFRVWVSGDGKLKVDLDVPAAQDYDIEVYDEDGNLLGTGYKGTGVAEHLSVEAGEGWYYIAIFPYGNSGSDVDPYSLKTDFTTNWF